MLYFQIIIICDLFVITCQLLLCFIDFYTCICLEKRGRKRKKDDFDENSMGLDDPVLLAVNEEGM